MTENMKFQYLDWYWGQKKPRLHVTAAWGVGFSTCLHTHNWTKFNSFSEYTQDKLPHFTVQINNNNNNNSNTVAVVLERTVPTELLPLVGEVLHTDHCIPFHKLYLDQVQ
jgi:hypothetical protein